MRIIAGTAGRTAIRVPASVTRPTTDFVRQAIFSILGERVTGARALDLFAGSGALGLEALSRGAVSCTFVDAQRQAVKAIEENLRRAKLAGGRALAARVRDFLKRDSARYDLIFADPPYWRYAGDDDLLADLLTEGACLPRLAEDGWLVAEASSSYRPPETADWVLQDRRSYGGSAVFFFTAAGRETS